MITRAYARKEPEPRAKPKNASTKILGFGISMVGIVILSIALIMGLEFPSFVHDRVVHDICIAGQDHKFYRKWRLEEDWVRYNKLYFWVIENPDEFLFHGQPPLFNERGPYIYKEMRKKLNPVFHGPTVKFQYEISQTFDDTLTKRECGLHCNENDQLYVFNLDFLKRVTAINSLDNLIYNKLPDVVKDALQNTSITQTVDMSVVLAFLGCLSPVCEDQTANNISNKQSLYDVSIGVFIQQNDTWYKERILQHRSGQSFTELEMSNFYNLVENHDVIGVSQSKLTNTKSEVCKTFALNHLCNSSDIEALSYHNVSTNEIADFISFHKSCGLIYILIAVADVGCLSNVTSELVGYINDVTGVSWLNVTMNEHSTILPQAYLLLLKDFILVKLFNFVYSKIFIDNYPSIIQKRSQRQIALGYINEGLYVHENNSYNVYRQTWELSTCLENRNRDNNMAVREFNGSQYAPQSVFPEGSNRQVYGGATRYVPMPSRYVTCESLSPQRQSYSVFVEDLYRDVLFSKPVKTTLYRTTLFEYSLDKEFYSRSLRGHSSCMIQMMDNIYKFPSVISNPHFFGCNEDSHNLFKFFPSTENHISKIGIEPRTGNIWSQNIRLQTNTHLNISHIKTRNHAPFNISHLDKVFPVYWIDRAAQTSLEEAQYYEEKVSKLLDASCGGLIGFSIIAVSVVIISVLVAFVPHGRNKVAPAPVTEDTHAIYASPLTC